jgi:Tol biopolymer transport system component
VGTHSSVRRGWRRAPLGGAALLAVSSLMTPSGAQAIAEPPANTIAYVVFDQDHLDFGDIWYMDTDGKNQRNVTNTIERDERWPAWSPDGTKIAFASREIFDSEIVLMNADGSELNNITRNPTNFETMPAWSPNGQWLALANNQGIQVRSVTGSIIRQLTSTSGVRDSQPTFVSNTDIVFTRIDAQSLASDLFRVPIGGGGVTRVTTDLAADDAPDGGPSGQIAFSHADPNGNVIYSMPAGGGTRRRLTPSECFPGAGAPDWAPDGNAIVYQRTCPLGTDIWTVQLDNRSRTNLTNTRNRTEAQPVFRPTATDDDDCLLLIPILNLCLL